MSLVTEQDLISAGLTAPRVTPADIELAISSEHYFTAAQWAALRNEILRAKPVENQFIQVPMSLSTSPFDGRTIEANSKPCGIRRMVSTSPFDGRTIEANSKPCGGCRETN